MQGDESRRGHLLIFFLFYQAFFLNQVLVLELSLQQMSVSCILAHSRKSLPMLLSLTHRPHY